MIFLLPVTVREPWCLSYKWLWLNCFFAGVRRRLSMQENGHFASSNEMVRPGKCEKFVCSSALPMYIRFIHNYALDYTKPQFMQPIVHLLSLVNINNCTFYTVYINSSVGLFVKFSVLLLRFVIRFVASAYTLSIKAYTLSIKTIKAYMLSIKTIKA